MATSTKRTRQVHNIALTEQCDNHGNFKSWKIVCGSIDRDGKRKPKPFYLGKDQARAEKLAIRIRDKWKTIAASAYNVAPVWTDGDLAAIKLWLNDREVLTADEKSKMSVHAVLDRYVADWQDREAKSLVCGGRFWLVEWMTKQLRKMIPDIPMAMFDEQQIIRLSRHLKMPYISKKTGRPISAETITSRLSMAKQFLDWADTLNFWQAPKLFYRDKKLWVLNRNERNLFPPKPQQARILSMGEVVALYKAAKQPMPKLGTKCYAMFLCAMNLGFSHSEFATLKADELFTDTDGTTWIKRHRRKTGVYAEWRLWPETVAAIEAVRAPENAWGLVFLNEWGLPISPRESNHRPTTLSWWSSFQKLHQNDADFPKIGFKYLRKTSADHVRKLSNKDASEAFLSHADDKTTAAYTRQDWERLAVATDALRVYLFGALEPQQNYGKPSSRPSFDSGAVSAFN